MTTTSDELLLRVALAAAGLTAGAARAALVAEAEEVAEALAAGTLSLPEAKRLLTTVVLAALEKGAR